jgi:hypothetical protein
MGTHWVGPHGIDVEAIVLNDRDRLRVRKHRAVVGYARDLDQLTRMLELYGVGVEELEEIEDTGRNDPG